MKYFVIFGKNKIINKIYSYPAELGSKLQDIGYKPTYLRIEPILNYSAGNISPEIKGEIFVLSDGTEVDLSLGIYERTCNTLLNNKSYLTLGKILASIVEKSNGGYYDADIFDFSTEFNKFIEEHVDNLISEPLIMKNGKRDKIDSVIIDIYGIIENMSLNFFTIGLLRFIKKTISKGNELFVMCCDKCEKNNDVSSLIKLFVSEEIDTSIYSYINSDNGYSLKCLKNTGKSFSVANSWEWDSFEKVFNKNNITDILNGKFSCPDFYKQKYDKCNLDNHQAIVSLVTDKNQKISYEKNGNYDGDFKEISINKTLIFENKKINKPEKTVIKIILVSEFSENSNGYCSLESSLIYANVSESINVNIKYFYINDQKYINRENIIKDLEHADGIIMPGGFSSNAIDIKLEIIKFARENNIPFLGICLGFQLALIEFAKNVLDISDATSEEFNKNAKNLIIKRVENIKCTNTNGDIFLGDYNVDLDSSSDDINIYSKNNIVERYRHRYAFDHSLKSKFEEKGLRFFARSSCNRIVAFKLTVNKFYVGVQYHPELISDKIDIDPIIRKFVESCSF